MVALPFIDAGVAAAVGASLVPPGPSLDDEARGALVAGLRAAAAASEAPVAEVTRLDVAARGPMPVVDRATWVRANVEMALTMIAEASGEPLPRPATLGEKVAGRANGAQLGAALAAVGTRILGQFLPFAETPVLVLVAPNIAKAEADLGVDARDFRLWVCLHEQTHRLQFARAPWLRGYLLAELGQVLLDDEGAASGLLRNRPHTLIEAVTTPRQRDVLARVTAVMSLLEGYADDMMDRVGPAVVPSVATIRSRFEARRHRGGWTRMLNRALGMDLKLAQYRDGARFCRAVINRVGVDGLNAVYDGPATLPRPDEIHDPARWVARVHG